MFTSDNTLITTKISSFVGPYKIEIHTCLVLTILKDVIKKVLVTFIHYVFTRSGTLFYFDPLRSFITEVSIYN